MDLVRFWSRWSRYSNDHKHFRGTMKSFRKRRQFYYKWVNKHLCKKIRDKDQYGVPKKIKYKSKGSSGNNIKSLSW